MLEDIVGDYKDKTVTLEDFPFFDTPVKTASVHPCKHASVMKVLLDRADAALQLRREKLKSGTALQGSSRTGRETLVAQTERMNVGSGVAAGAAGSDGLAAGLRAGGQGAPGGGEEWEVLQHEPDGDVEEEGSAIRVDQYIVVFLKFMASVTPGIEHDFTMGV